MKHINPCSEKITIIAETSNDTKSNIQCWSWLIVSMTFLQFLCSVIRKVLQRRKRSVPWWPRDRQDSRIMPHESWVWKSPCHVAPRTRGWNHPSEDLTSGPLVLKADQRCFDSRLFNRRHHVCISSPKACVDCCFLQKLLRIWSPIGGWWCRSPPVTNLKKLQFGPIIVSILHGDFVLPVQWLSVNMPPCMFGKQGLQIQLEIFAHLEVRRAFLSLEAVCWRGSLDCFIGSWASFGFLLDRRRLSPFPQQLDHTPPGSRPRSFTLQRSVSASRPSARPLSPSPRLSVRALFFHPLTSLAGHWFGFAVPTRSLSGASVVAEENRYPFYVFIFSQIKKPMN